MVEKSSFTTKKRSGTKGTSFDWGSANRPWEDEIDTSENLGIRDGKPTTPQKPVSDVTVDVTVGVEGKTVFSFDGSGTTDPQDSALTYEWDFKDGNTVTGNGPTVTHTFSDTGTYSVEIIVTNELGKTDTDTVTVTIGPDQQVISSDTTLEPGTHEFPGGLLIESGVTVTAKGDTTADANGNYGGVKIVTDGKLTVNGEITAAGNGYQETRNGPGQGKNQYHEGAAYGGNGGGSYGYITGGTVYGDANVANRLGSSSQSAGGGAVWLVSNDDDITVNGVISANADPDTSRVAAAGSGGSVRLEAMNGEILGSGVVTAEGGECETAYDWEYNGGGGGGRVLFKGTDASSISVSVVGGTASGGSGNAGTVVR